LFVLDFFAPDVFAISNWTNRMILGESLQVMASLTEREAIE
jgi:hypothetical protein